MEEQKDLRGEPHLGDSGFLGIPGLPGKDHAVTDNLPMAAEAAPTTAANPGGTSTSATCPRVESGTNKQGAQEEERANWRAQFQLVGTLMSPALYQ